MRHNIAALCGFTAIGGGNSNMEILSVLNIPSPDQNTLKKTKEQVRSEAADMLDAGQEEKWLTMTAIMQCHSDYRYSAKSGVAVITGERTKKSVVLSRVRKEVGNIHAVVENKKILLQSHKCC